MHWPLSVLGAACWCGVAAGRTNALAGQRTQFQGPGAYLRTDWFRWNANKLDPRIERAPERSGSRQLCLIGRFDARGHVLKVRDHQQMAKRQWCVRDPQRHQDQSDVHAGLPLRSQ